MPELIGLIIIVGGAVLLLGLLGVIVKCYRKVEQGTSIIRTGVGGTRVSFEGTQPLRTSFRQFEIPFFRIFLRLIQLIVMVAFFL